MDYRMELADLPIERLHRVGPLKYQDHVYEFVRQIKPDLVVETGVRSGVSTLLILEALERNNQGSLFSCDPCYASKAAAVAAIESATGWVFGAKAERWVFAGESSRKALARFPLKNWDLFIHDSDHGRETMTWELEFAWVMLRPGGYLVCDDWDTCALAAPHQAFRTFCAQRELSWEELGSAALVRKL